MKDPNDFLLKFVMDEAERAKKASVIVLNKFEELEHDIIDTLLSILPPIYAVGPLHIHLNQIKDDDLKFLESNLWVEESECLE
ncbi:unnamed protein product [Ilex paraguariensis]|uniref:Uncharacterized protein n=1 Tax=Ilex paraguariensis TaxID=185542 RepID=A0ABC8SSJ4_9AQUA